MAFGTIELPEAIPPRLDRPRIMTERPSASAAPIRLARRSPERPLQPPNQQEDNHHDRPHRQIDQSVIAVVHRLFSFSLCQFLPYKGYLQTTQEFVSNKRITIALAIRVQIRPDRDKGLSEALRPL